MNWSYVAGYFDGEASLLLAISHDKRKYIGSQTDGWTIQPILCVTSFDREALLSIKSFLESEGHPVYKLETKKQRPRQLDKATRLSILKWDNVLEVCKHLGKVSIVKAPQYEIYSDLYEIWRKRPIIPGNNPCHKRGWSKESFLTAMALVDKINSHKCRNRGKYNQEYFRNLWHIPSLTTS